MTTLHDAAAGGDIETAKLLIDHGADVNIEDSNHRTASEYAAKMGYEDVVKLLRDHTWNR